MANKATQSIYLKTGEKMSLYFKGNDEVLREGMSELAKADDRSLNYVTVQAAMSAYNVAEEAELMPTLTRVSAEQDRSINYLMMEAMRTKLNGSSPIKTASKKPAAKKVVSSTLKPNKPASKKPASKKTGKAKA